MNIFTILYTLVIGPLKLLFEVIYTLSYYVTQSAGLSVVLLSVAMNLFLLPLYNKADKIQEEENEIEKKLKPGVDHIKKSFKGDERYMVLQAYYRQNNYKQTNVLKGSISLLLEVPFFIAAYDFLSNLLVLHNASFGPISNLSVPDRLLTIGSISINVLPILMTLFNIVSSIIYTKGQPLRSKIQLFGMAALFLILLYNSPSALLLYWTLNNIFSLLKNIIMKCRNPGIIFCSILSFSSVIGIIYILINPMPTQLIQYGLFITLVLFNIPLIIKITKTKFSFFEKLRIDNKTFIFSTVYLSVLTGLLIPSSVISSSPSEFIDYHTLINPLFYIFNSFVLAIGIFAIWFNIYYFLMNENTKKTLCILFPILCVIASINYLFFGLNLGILSNTLRFDSGLNIDKTEMLINLFVITIVFVVLLRIKIKHKILTIAIVCLIIMSSINCNKIYETFLPSKKVIEDSLNTVPSISLSKDKKNVVVIILDRAISSYIPYIFEEKEILQEQFAGFTYYPNTMSFGWHTIYAMPPVYGGYEYTPKEMNERDNELLRDKHNEALKVLPVLFSNEGYDVTLFDPPYAGYEEIPDLSIFDEYQNIKAYNTVYGTFESNFVAENNSLGRNLFCYSIMKVMPLCLQSVVYNYGAYNSIDYYNEIYNESAHDESYPKQSFMYSYSVLKNLSNITNTNNTKPSLFIMTNYATHETTLLQEPEYIPIKNINNNEYDSEHIKRYSIDGNSVVLETKNQYEHYETNMSVFIQIGQWLDYLKKLNVYDNTRIIIVSDHGHYLEQFDELLLNDNTKNNIDIMQFNPVLLYKDFNSQENFNTVNDFMTNADVPTLATSDLIKDPINPFTNEEINNNKKYDEEYQMITPSNNYSLSKNSNDYTFNIDFWLEVKENIFDVNNWALHN